MSVVWRFYDELWAAERYVWNAFASAGFPSRPVGFVTLLAVATFVGVVFLAIKAMLFVLPFATSAWLEQYTLNVCVGAAVVFIVLGVVRLMTRVETSSSKTAHNG